MSNEQTEIHQQLNNVFVAVKNLTSDGIVNKIEPTSQFSLTVDAKVDTGLKTFRQGLIAFAPGVFDQIPEPNIRPGTSSAFGQTLKTVNHLANMEARLNLWWFAMLLFTFMAEKIHKDPSISKFLLAICLTAIFTYMAALKLLKERNNFRIPHKLPFVGNIGENFLSKDEKEQLKKPPQLKKNRLDSNVDHSHHFIPARQTRNANATLSNIIHCGLLGLQKKPTVFDADGIAGIVLAAATLKNVDCKIELFRTPDQIDLPHAFVVFNRGQSDPSNVSTWNDDAYILDPWHQPDGVFLSVNEIKSQQDFFDRYPFLKTANQQVADVLQPANMQNTLNEFKTNFQEQLQNIESELAELEKSVVLN